MKTYGVVEIYVAPPFITSVIDGGDWSSSRPCRLTLGTQCIGGWAGPRAGLDLMEILKASFPYQEPNHGLVAIPIEPSRLNKMNGLYQWYSTFFVRVPPNIISLQLSTPKVVGV
jgi:hypothetical protein